MRIPQLLKCRGELIPPLVVGIPVADAVQEEQDCLVRGRSIDVHLMIMAEVDLTRVGPMTEFVEHRDS
ncbi:hypothetical protein AUV07_05440 [Microbacterium sp. CH1]|nr:hypothetical protein AUV07_05440 [Microbacterium sp. CH1]